MDLEFCMGAPSSVIILRFLSVSVAAHTLLCAERVSGDSLPISSDRFLGASDDLRVVSREDSREGCEVNGFFF